jgi:hypothetical protein
VDERFLQSWFVRRDWRVLGRRLQPFSLAHRLTLEAIGSPLCRGNELFTFTDLALAVCVCASPDPFRRIPAPSWADRVRFWHSTFRPAWFRSEAEAFIAYLDEHTSGPKFWEREEDGARTDSTPWPLVVATTLIRRTSLREREVWAMPLGRALWYHAAVAKLDGARLDILTTEEEAMLERLRQEVAP